MLLFINKVDIGALIDLN